MNKYIVWIMSVYVCLTLCSGVMAVQKQPDTPQESMQMNRAWHERADQNSNAPAPNVSTLQQPDVENRQTETNNIANTERVGNPDDTDAVKTAAKDIQEQNPVYRTIITVVKIAVCFVICLTLTWALWKATLARQQRKMLENVKKAQQMARDLRDRPDRNSF